MMQTRPDPLGMRNAFLLSVSSTVLVCARLWKVQQRHTARQETQEAESGHHLDSVEANHAAQVQALQQQDDERVLTLQQERATLESEHALVLQRLQQNHATVVEQVAKDHATVVDQKEMQVAKATALAQNLQEHVSFLQRNEETQMAATRVESQRELREQVPRKPTLVIDTACCECVGICPPVGPPAAIDTAYCLVRVGCQSPQGCGAQSAKTALDPTILTHCQLCR
jgi:hypothetical protein